MRACDSCTKPCVDYNWCCACNSSEICNNCRIRCFVGITVCYKCYCKVYDKIDAYGHIHSLGLRKLMEDCKNAVM